jgi:molecular chaperone GrpE
MEDQEHLTTEEQEAAAAQAGDVQHIQESLQACETQMQEWRSKCLRVTADFENFKKRQEKERSQWEFFAQYSILKDLLDIIDNFDRARLELRKEDGNTEKAWYKGFEMIEKSFDKYLDKIQVKEIKDTASFNPELHEAVTTVATDAHASGDIVEVLQKGYKFKDHLLRPAKVSIAQ